MKNQCDESCPSYKPCTDRVSRGRPRCEIEYGHIIPKGFQDFSQFVGCASKGVTEHDEFHRGSCNFLCGNFTDDQKCKAAGKRKIPDAFMSQTRTVGCESFKKLPEKEHYRRIGFT
jgi:hypothetical protein